MALTLSDLERKALKALDDECTYEDARTGETNNFIPNRKFPPGIGNGTRSKLVDRGLAIEGPCRQGNETGLRITDKGRAALETPPPAKKPRTAPRLNTLKPRLASLPPRIRSRLK